MLRALDRAPLRQDFSWTLSEVDGAQIDGVHVVVKQPSGAEVEWVCTNVVAAESSVSASYLLAIDGSDLPVPGRYVYRAYFFASSSLVYVSEVDSLDIGPTLVSYPEDL